MPLCVSIFNETAGRRPLRETYCEKREQNNAAAPHVGAFPVVRDPLYDLRRCVVRRPAGRLCDIRLHKSRESEVRDFDVEVLVEQNILWLQVAVADAERVEIFEAVNNLAEEPRGLLVRQAPVLNEVVEELAVRRVLEHDVEITRALEDVDQLEKVGVVDEPHERNFALDFDLEVGLALEQGFRDDFNGALAIRRPFNC